MSDKKTECFKALGLDSHQWEVFSLTYDALRRELAEANGRIDDALQALQQAGPWVEIVGDAIKILRGENT